jgi:hypothetical protein
MSWDLESETYVIYYNCDVVGEFENEITAANVRDTAINLGIKQLSVTDEYGDELEDYDFPVKQNVTIAQVNKAG